MGSGDTQTGRLPAGAEIAIAGALAETGLTGLALDGDPLTARKTDLPGLLRAAGPGATLTGTGLRITKTGSGWQWQASGPAADALRALAKG